MSRFLRKIGITLLIDEGTHLTNCKNRRKEIKSLKYQIFF